MLFLSIKALHIIFVTSWFAGLFYLPRLFVNHAMVTDKATLERLALMENKLYRFMTPWASWRWRLACGCGSASVFRRLAACQDDARSLS